MDHNDHESDSSGMSLEAAVEHITGTDPRFALTQACIHGTTYTVFANAPANLRALLQTSSDAYGDREMLVYEDQRWNHDQFCDEVKRLAQGMAGQLEVAPGDRVAIAMRNYPEMLVLIMAAASMGAVAVPMNAWWSADELRFALKDCGARVVFADGPRYEAVASHAETHNLTLVAVRDAQGPLHYEQIKDRAKPVTWSTVDLAPDDDVVVLYSSGSSGTPKGAVLTHRGAISAVYSLMMAKEMQPLITPVDDGPPPPQTASLVVTPLFHVTALNSMFLQGLATGAKIVLMYKWDPELAVELINAEQITRFLGVPTQSAELMDAARRLGQELPSLASIVAGGAKRPAAQVNLLAQAFPHAVIASGWGMTETNGLGIVASGADYLDRPDTAGKLTPPLQEALIVDEQGLEVPTGQVGELLIKSPANMRCYLNQPEATDTTLRDGWLYTGDLARMDDDGFFYIVDRKKTIIIRGGENISCLEVEGALHHQPGIAEACVFPIPDERLGEVVGAAVYLLPDADVTEAELRHGFANHLAAFKIPERIWFWPAPLPRGGTGKIDRQSIRNECTNIPPPILSGDNRG